MRKVWGRGLPTRPLFSSTEAVSSTACTQRILQTVLTLSLTVDENKQGLTLVHPSAQTVPCFPLTSPSVCHKSAYIEPTNSA